MPEDSLTVIDSDIIIDYLAGKKSARMAILNLLLQDKIPSTTVINISELFRGVLHRKWEQKRQDQLQSLLDSFIIIDYDHSTATLIGDLLAQLDIKGKPIGFADTAIAGLCLSKDASLLTNNNKHFSIIPNLVLEE